MHITGFIKASVLALAAASVASPVPELEPRKFENFKKQMLDAQNWYRGQHGAAPLTWNDNLARNAKDWASKCSTNPRHQPNNRHGENIAWGGGITNAYGWANIWGHERIHYDFNNPGFNGHTGHFTQVVWKATKNVGCAWHECSYGYNVVCEYDPTGNIVGDNGAYFKRNVGKQIRGRPGDQYRPR